jgi:hypothetical protein
MITAVLATVLVFAVPWLVIAAYVHGVRFEQRRQERADRHLGTHRAPRW